VVEVVEMVSDDLVEGEPGGAGLRLDDRRRSILATEVAVDGICLEAIGKLCEELFRPLGVGVLATERRLCRDSVLELEIRCTPMRVVERVLFLGSTKLLLLRWIPPRSVSTGEAVSGATILASEMCQELPAEYRGYV
jgi:hypothetical protein